MTDLPKNSNNSKIWNPLGHMIYELDNNNNLDHYYGLGQGDRPLHHLNPKGDYHKPQHTIDSINIIIAGCSKEYAEGFEAGAVHAKKKFLGNAGLNKVGGLGSNKYRIDKKATALINEYNQSLRIPRVEMNAFIDGNADVFPQAISNQSGDGYYELSSYHKGMYIIIRQYMKEPKEIFQVKYDTKILKTEENINKVNEVLSEIFPQLETSIKDNKNIEVEITTDEETVFELYTKFSEFVEKITLHK